MTTTNLGQADFAKAQEAVLNHPSGTLLRTQLYSMLRIHVIYARRWQSVYAVWNMRGSAKVGLIRNSYNHIELLYGAVELHVDGIN